MAKSQYQWRCDPFPPICCPNTQRLRRKTLPREPGRASTARCSPLLVGDGGAGRAGERHDVYLFEPGLFAPSGEVAACEIKGVAELDQHVERHEQPERVLAASVVDDVLDDDVSPALWEGVIGGLDQVLL